ncbi:MAG: hypothetical protein LQ346_007828 [Caloplaca aetnensis]|nr:MAG: hypothetical protein LQ346_007828 [Caloplaca aetnensis]
MPSILYLSFLFLFTSSCLSVPLSGNPSSNAVHNLHRRCGPVAEFYNQKASDWNANNLDGWLDTWWATHQTDIAANSKGFAGAFGRWAVGNPDWSCRDDGSSSNCDFDICNDDILNAKGNETRQAYYVMESVNRLHSYFAGLSQAFQTASIAAALSKDSWATMFYKDKDVKSVTALKEVLNVATTVIGIGAAFAALAPAGVGIGVGAAGALFSGAVGAAIPLLGTHQDDTLQKSADLGGILGNIVLEAMKGFISANNILMHGDSFENTGDIRAYLKDGLFLNFGGVDKVAVIEKMNAMLLGQAVNALWRTQKVFIMGGGACGDNQGIGSGPQEIGVCLDGKAWYLYWWEEPDGIRLSKHRYGWTSAPMGADQLGQGDFAGVTVADVIASSLSAHTVANHTYTPTTALARAHDAIASGRGINPGAAWEGVFTIPVCDVGWAVAGDIAEKAYILQPLGEDYRPRWCGPVCGGDAGATRAWIEAAGMAGFESPREECEDEDDVGY